MAEHYPISSYDKYLCLKPDVTMWLILLFLLKPYLVLVLSITNLKDKSGLINMVYPDHLAMSLGALASVPVTLIIYAWSKRKPGASPFVRSIWAKGRSLLIISAVLNAGVIFIPLWVEKWRTLSNAEWVHFGIAILIAFMVYTTPYIRDCFNDFPKDDASVD